MKNAKLSFKLRKCFNLGVEGSKRGKWVRDREIKKKMQIQSSRKEINSIRLPSVDINSSPIEVFLAPMLSSLSHSVKNQYMQLLSHKFMYTQYYFQ